MSDKIDVLAILADYSAQHGDPEDFEACRAAVAELIATQRGCRDMLREAAKMFRLYSELGHAPLCDLHADKADTALATCGGAA